MPDEGSAPDDPADPKHDPALDKGPGKGQSVPPISQYPMCVSAEPSGVCAALTKHLHVEKHQIMYVHLVARQAMHSAMQPVGTTMPPSPITNGTDIP